MGQMNKAASDVFFTLKANCLLCSGSKMRKTGGKCTRTQNTHNISCEFNSKWESVCWMSGTK